MENLEALEKGLPNLLKHIENVTKVWNLPAVVAINRFPHRHRRGAGIGGAQRAQEYWASNVALSEVWAKGGEGGIALAKEVLRAVRQQR